MISLLDFLKLLSATVARPAASTGVAGPQMEITAWLRGLGLERYVEEFRANEVTAEAQNAKRVSGTFNHGAAVPVEVTDEPTEVKITRTSPGWPELSMSVWIQRVSGVPTVVGIRR